MTQDEMKKLAQNFRDNVEKILPDTPRNQDRIKEIKKLNGYVNQEGRKVCYHYNSIDEFIEKISMKTEDLTTKVVKYILDRDNNSVIDTEDVLEKSF